jgi:hypothetical protein
MGRASTPVTPPKTSATPAHTSWRFRGIIRSGATWARETWDTGVATYLTCTLPFAEVRQHLRKFLIVELEPGGTAFFRFYDPRVLRLFLPTCREDEWTTFFGPIDAFLVARADDLALLRYRRTAHGCAAELMHP